MNFNSKFVFLRTMGAVSACLICASVTSAQAEPQKPQMADQIFKNVQVLKGLSVNEFMGTMGFFSAALGLNCTDCHTAESTSDWQKFAEDTPLKQTARKMILMMNVINKTNFGGARQVTCYSCHRGTDRPEVIPSLAEQYGTPPPGDPDKVEILGQASRGPSAEQILDKYILALGGQQQLDKITSFIAKGTYEGYDTDFEKVPVEVFARTPSQRTTVAHTLIGDSTTTYDGQNGWVAAIDKPVPLLALTGEELDGAKVDANLLFPAQIRRVFTKWRAGFPPATIDDRPVQVIEGTTAAGSRVKFYFDEASGLLVRQVRYTSTPVGIIPTHVEYTDYRQVLGVKMPFQWTLTWTNGRAITKLTEIQPNVNIDASKFAKPAPAQPPKFANQ